MTVDRLAYGLLDAAPEAIMGLDPDGTIVLVNAQVERLFGYSRAEIVGQPLAVLVPSASAYPLGFRPMGPPVKLAGRRRDGSEFPAEMSLASVETEDGVVVSAAFRDATDRTRTAQALEELQERNAAAVAAHEESERALLSALEHQRAAAERLRQLDNIRDEMVTTISHELRTPLTSVLGYLEMMTVGDAGNLNETQHQMVEVVKRNADRLAALVEDLVVLFQLGDVPASGLGERLVVSKLISTAVEELRPALARRDQHLTVGNIPPRSMVHGDRGQLERVLENLLSNASAYTPQGGYIVIAAKSTGGQIDISISDSGIGIPAAELDLVFDRFFRASTAIKKSIGGTGLGLAIVKSIVDRHLGQVTVRSTVGHGATFTVTLPQFEK